MTTTDPTTTQPATPGLDLAPIQVRAEHYARLCHQIGNSHAPDLVKAAHACAGDLPALVAEVRRLRAELDAAPARTAGGDWIEPVIRRYFDMKDSIQWGVAFALIGELKAARVADELDAAPATPTTYALPAEPPELYAVLVPTSASPHVDWYTTASGAANWAAELATKEHPGYRAYRLAPLSSVPPAGTEAR